MKRGASPAVSSRLRAWIEADAKALRMNFARIRSAAGPHARVIAMVKADAYGLGVAGALRVLEAETPGGYGVATVEEGLELRKRGITRPILVMSPPPPDALSVALAGDLTLGISDPATLSALATLAARSGRTGAFHLEIDTGMGRAGVPWHAAGRWGRQVSCLTGSSLEWGGCYTHFHSADDDPKSIDRQWRRFRKAVGRLNPPAGVWLHACNSAAVLRRPAYAASAVRPGLFLFGGVSARDLPRPLPVSAVRARIVLVRDAGPGASLGYGATHVATAPERWATVAIGYGDGLPRVLGNRGHALLHGRRVPLIGRTSMDVTVVDITQVPHARPGDIVTFIGCDGDEQITVEETAACAGTINYEILTGFTPRLPRIWRE